MINLKFFVLIPVYKTEEFISKCIDSVLSQSYQNFHIVIVDDGSPDRAGEIADSYAYKDHRISVIHKENQGLISARRAAIDYVNTNYCCENDYFVFLDSDDTLQDNALSVIYECLCREKFDMVFFGLQRVHNGKVLFSVDNDPFVGVIEDKRELYRRVFFNSVYNPLCRKAIRCALVKSEDYSAFYHINTAEDLLQSIPIYRDCCKVAFVSDLLYNYSVNPASITECIDCNKYRIDSTVRREVWDFLCKQNVFSEGDLSEYLQYCRRLLRSEIIQIALFKLPYNKIRMLFQDIKKDRYYRMLLNGSKDYVLFFLKCGIYTAFVVPLRCRRALNSLRSYISKKNRR